MAGLAVDGGDLVLVDGMPRMNDLTQIFVDENKAIDYLKAHGIFETDKKCPK